ncbi:helix-turn-helix domain-containing protein [Paenibacillus alkalitolerans]|uniref:helix-turn-helix domain-containing protein n=1 Tax=Paenibacillus alkalitolerans TaxID=2799335 RepID=UPI0018F660BF|nr:helix-turn-helix domain-containing protein [Paenibacillus alkalitolerans]
MFLGKLRFNRHSILLTWFITYMCILFLPIGMSIIVYIESSRTLEAEIHEANKSLLKQLRETMDNQFQAMERLNLELTWNVRVRELLYSNKYETYPNEFRYDLHMITQDLKLFQTAYTSIDHFYIYYAPDNIVIQPNVYREGRFAYQLTHKTDSFRYEQWLSVVERKDAKGFIPMTRIDDDGKIHRTAAYISSYESDKGTPVATNVIMIDNRRIFHAIENMELFNQGHVGILNEDNQLLVTNSSDTWIDDFPFGKLDRSSGFFYIVQGGRKYEVFYLSSKHSPLKYVSVIPSSLYWEKAERIRKLTYMSIGISLLGGMVLSYFFLRRNYNPVRRLVQTFSGKSHIGTTVPDNEFHYLQYAVDTTLSEMEKIALQIDQQHHLLQANFIAKLLKGRLDRRIPFDEALTTHRIRFQSNAFAVLLMYVEESEPFFERYEGMQADEVLKLLHFIITNVVEELAAQQYQGYVTEIGDSMVCLINFSRSEEDERMADLLRIAREAQSFLRSKFGIYLTLSVSAIHEGVEDIPQAYVEALDAMEYKLVMGAKEILSYEQIRKEADDDAEAGYYYYPIQVEQQLMNYVKIGDFDKAKQTLEEVIERNFRPPVVSVPIARCLMLNMVSTLIKTISEIGDVQESFLIRNPKKIERLTACDTVHEMQAQMTEMLRLVCEFTSSKRQLNIQQSKKRALDELVRSVTVFITENYHDPNLNISMIGDRFGMKATYLSKLFKDHNGEGLLDFINKTRVEQAKKLISGSDNDKSLNHIAGNVGFNDVNALIRTFKKYEGITPGKYKELLGEE